MSMDNYRRLKKSRKAARADDWDFKAMNGEFIYTTQSGLARISLFDGK